MRRDMTCSREDFLMTVSSLKTGRPLLRHALIGAAMVWMIGFAAVPKASADAFTLNQIFCNCLPAGSTAGTVTLTQVGTDVTVDIALAPGLTFHESNGLDAFGFNAPLGLTAAAFAYTPGIPGWNLLFGPLHEDGAGTFRYGFACTPAPNGCVGDPSTFSFTIHGVTLGDVETTEGGAQNGGSNSDLAVNIANPLASGCTGMVGGGNGSSQSTASGGFSGDSPCGTSSSGPGGQSVVPEPASLLLLGTGLAIGSRRLRRRDRNQA
jgi:uncharacterized membrane protein YgcG